MVYICSVLCVLSAPCTSEKPSVEIKLLQHFVLLSSETQASTHKKKYHSVSCLSTDMTS